MKLALIFLTKNELPGLQRLFSKVALEKFEEVFAVDGGSQDGTREFFQNHRVKVLEQKSPGRGEAFRLAFEATQCDACVFFSPDGNEDPSDLPKFRSYLEEGYDMVIASRHMPGAWNEEDSRVLRFRKWANLAFGYAANFLWNKDPCITDTINGYRAITKKCFEALKPNATGFVIEYQLSIRAMKKGFRMAEFPTREGERIGGASGAKSLPTGWVFLKLLFKEIFIGKKF